MVKEERKEEEKIINMRISSDDLFTIFGFLSMFAQGFRLPTGVTKDVVMECASRVTALNINNREFIEAVQKEE